MTISTCTEPEHAVGAANGVGAYVLGRNRDYASTIAPRLHAGEIRLGARLLDLADGSAQSFRGTSGIGGHRCADVLKANAGTRVVGEENYELPL
jgi:betaine-aldehyde dehydrogenase